MVSLNSPVALHCCGTREHEDTSGQSSEIWVLHRKPKIANAAEDS
jgi:hypothetical protein